MNEIMMKQECIIQRKKGLFLEKFEYDDNSQDVYLLDGMPIIARKNCKELDIFNNETFIIKEIQYNNKIIVIVDDDDDVMNKIPFDKFQHLFYVAYAITIYKSKGSTFDFPYTVHEYGHPMYDDRLKYVSLSRSTSIERINIIEYEY